MVGFLFNSYVENKFVPLTSHCKLKISETCIEFFKGDKLFS